MDSAILSLLGAFVLSIIGLLVFLWSLRRGLLVENPVAASVIFAPGEVGTVDDPALSTTAQQSMQRAAGLHDARQADVDAIEARVAADQSTAFPVFVFIAFDLAPISHSR